MPLTANASLALLLVTLGYFALCAVSPFGRCRKCEGIGFRLTTTRAGRPRRGRDCRRCKGVGLRIRTGRRVLNHLDRIRRNANR
ncbi:hypothetical protein GCM10022245_57640 [Streptomyces mayteni]